MLKLQFITNSKKYATKPSKYSQGCAGADPPRRQSIPEAHSAQERIKSALPKKNCAPWSLGNERGSIRSLTALVPS